MPRIVIAGFAHETNTFAPTPTVFADFTGYANAGAMHGAKILANPDFALPMHFFQGDRDLYTVTSEVEAYAAAIAAPRKSFSLLEGGGHSAIFLRDAAVFEPAFRRARHAQAELPLNILRAESGRVLLHDESAHSSVIVLRPNYFHIRDGRVADPALAPIQDIMIAVACGAGFHSARV